MEHQVPHDLVELGRVTGAYGIRGWLKVQPHATGGAALLSARQWWLKEPGSSLETGLSVSLAPFSVQASRPQGSTVVAQLQGLADRNRAETFKGFTIWVPRSQFPQAEDDEYYWVDLVGCSLYGQNNGVSELIGLVREVSDNGAHAVLHVERGHVSDQGGFQPVLSPKGQLQHVLVPFVKAHVHTVDLAARRLDSNWPVEL